uniref:ORF3 protein n=1 Tax=Bat Coronavirus RlYN16 TaxID=3018892 RepID=A0AA49EE60_9NIDO|nr:ORF3 protein [Bat Coronavirus RlYN16]WCC63102.1 ORF3 protein [Bat Coronavirus RlYN16]
MDAINPSPTIPPQDVQLINDVVQGAEEYIHSTTTVALILYATFSVILWFLSKSRYPYVRIMAHTVFCLLQAGVLLWLMFVDNKFVSIFAQGTVVICAFACFLERLILAIMLRSLAPFATTADNFAIVKTTCDTYVFPVESSKENLVVLTTSRGLYCNGIHVSGSVAVADSARIVSLFKSSTLLLDRVEHGYDYTVFIYINSVILENTHPKVGVINQEFDNVEL